MVMGEEGFPHGYKSAASCRIESFQAYSIDIKGLAKMLASLVSKEALLTQKSSCQGGTTHYHRYIPQELLVSPSSSISDAQAYQVRQNSYLYLSFHGDKR